MRHDEVKLSRFLQNVRSAALAFTCFRVRDEEVALDLLQEAMIGFTTSAKKYDEEIWKNIFYKILGRRITDWQRKQIWRNRIVHIIPFSGLSSESEESDPIEFLTDNDEEPEQNYNAEQLSQHFEAALAKLPPRQQEAYLLRQWQTFSVKDTAVIMKCSEGSVKTHLSRAMQTLREQLGEWIDEK